MSIFKKIMTAIRGGASEVGESIVDSNATRIFEQEIRDSENHLTKAKRDLTGVMAQQMSSSREVDRLKREVVEHEGYAVQALEKGDETLALAVAEKISTLENDLASQQQALDSFSGSANRLKELVKKSERQVGEYKRQLSMVKTTESVQKATSAITDNFSSSNSKLLNAKDSLERIKAKQQKFDDQMKAAEVLESENSDNSLAAQLKQAGIGGTDNSANSVLDRLKAKQK
ncbi:MULTISPECIES: PspA/IM30 family protein [Colwellia]|jgi:phage shock protein A|uniref:PspA/IM30 family protein n=1 Tax=Colwellia hornerae TaxID=89402 RepID=A0A5C6Q9U5_9GAMM|nr:MULTISPECIES: PspA/IM30 family protein [Colwellia]MBA6230716.1 PspA/IM30 family protein [Colwellia sp. MB02u-7]MBA6234647.1 PspA/IM30 family protein [Colwellia sp. MB02u-11]MBA6255511.1 PspA/IM30 family protein [Colwellia sp. MB3u-28]MBA6261651.1 PspA/IM30 family protein [Colwellia sp. MB3u-41]MBA6263012.1 PspA/IM30 family protein [Colwellia sp. Bg11-12]